MAKRTTDPGRLKGIQFGPGGITVEFDEAPIDALALAFCAHLNRSNVRYAVVSGYPAILLGRSRESEDVDILAERMDRAAFRRLHRKLARDFECISPGGADRLYSDYLDAGEEATAVRYAFPGRFVPNVEFKFAKTALQALSVATRVPVLANGSQLYIGPLEIQIAYKVWLRTPKDLEDARWIWRIAGGHLDEAEVRRAATKLGLSPEEVAKTLEVD